MSNPNPVCRFKKGDPNRPKGGRPKGAKDKATVLREKLLDAALNLNLDDKNIKRSDIMKVAASFVPKEIKGDMTGSLEIRWME
jgi:hypothetical protein